MGRCCGVSDDGQAIQHPVFVASGSNDLIIPTVNALVLARRLPNAQLIMYPDSGHGFLFQYHTLFVKYEKVVDALEVRLGSVVNWEEIVQPLIAPKASWEQITQVIEEHIGTSGLSIFSSL